MDEREFNALGDLALIVTFIPSLSSTVPLPAFSNKKGRSFITAFHAVEEVDNLLEPGMANGALKSFDEYVVETRGTKLGFLYQDLVDDCVSKIHEPQSAITRIREEPVQSQQIFKVKGSTFAAFSTLFSKSTVARGSITWDAFTAAMADLKFSTIQKSGSVVTFSPCEKETGQKDVTIHRPHQSRIEGVKLLQISRRLERVLGWGENTFTTD
ncbi:hypothetical protein DPSP01_008090 [Paraphaeosphaeria sporulosa]|uniref:Uncharacterized protein n=1 Tax=Paraphaeosphaeria sporulosa TaxID=1460663 RepID=A0A177CQ65_9PLEO|nr:uncharacterized protein CC84DRAFT_1215378 [Paraphaeosphaeria sporulosa]OAG08919.1 hypothetical protein CC84DRAFT_1215378 [Paraphaeosphaeria sporulosa]